MSSAASVSVDLSRIRDILDLCSPSSLETCHGPDDSEPTPKQTHPSDPSPSQWVRLSRRPSVDEPDENELRLQDEGQVRPQGNAAIPLAVTDDISLRETSPNQIPTASVEPPGFPADLFFNGISQDVSTWWNAFDTYDPDSSNF